MVKDTTRTGDRVFCWGREVSTRPGGRVVWHDQVRFFQLARQQLQITWNQHKYAICMQIYPKHAKWWRMMRNGIKQWWYDAKVMTNGCSKHAKYTLIRIELCYSPESINSCRIKWMDDLKLNQTTGTNRGLTDTIHNILFIFIGGDEEEDLDEHTFWLWRVLFNRPWVELQKFSIRYSV